MDGSTKSEATHHHESPLERPFLDVDPWLRGLRRGALLVIVAVWLPILLINTIAFSFPLLGIGFSSLVYFRWIGLVFAAPLLIGIYDLTRAAPGKLAPRRDLLRWSVRAVGTAYVTTDSLYSIARLATLPGDAVWAAADWILELLTPVLVMLYVSRLHRMLGKTTGASAATHWAIAYVLFTFASVLSDWIELAGGISAQAGGALNMVRLLVSAAMWAWGLFVMLRFAKLAKLRLRHDCCINCGYSLVGAVEPRCPECGEPFDLITAYAVSPKDPGTSEETATA